MRQQQQRGAGIPLAPPPLVPILDGNDAAMRVRNYRKSCDACPDSWQTYFEVLMSEISRQMPQ